MITDEIKRVITRGAAIRLTITIGRNQQPQIFHVSKEVFLQAVIGMADLPVTDHTAPPAAVGLIELLEQKPKNV